MHFTVRRPKLSIRRPIPTVLLLVKRGKVQTTAVFSDTYLSIFASTGGGQEVILEGVVVAPKICRTRAERAPNHSIARQFKIKKTALASPGLVKIHMSWGRNVNSISCSHGKWWAPHCLKQRFAASAVPNAALRHVHGPAPSPPRRNFGLYVHGHTAAVHVFTGQD